MPKYTATRGANCRRYYDTEIEAATPEEAFEKAKLLMHEDHASAWVPSQHGHKVSDDLSEPCCAMEGSLSVVDEEDDEVLLDFTAIPTENEPAHYHGLLAFARRVARMSTPEDEFEDDPQGHACVDDLVADMSGDRLFDEYQAFMTLVRDARYMLAFPKGDEA